MRLVRDILLNVGDELDDRNGESEQDDQEEEKDNENKDNESPEQEIMFGGQRRFGIHPNNHQGPGGRNGHRHNQHDGHSHSLSGNYGGDHDARSNIYDCRCFKCGGTTYTVATSKEPRNKARIEANVTVWRRTKNIKRTIKQINLTDKESPSYLIA